MRCSFCSVAAFNRCRLRTRPVEEVIAELRTLGPHVIFLDDNITGDREYALELFAAMIPLRKVWFSQCSVGIADDEELLRLAVRSGCHGLFIGFESLSTQALHAWHKHANRDRDYRQAVRRLHQAGIGVFAGFVFGSDEDTTEAFPRTLEFLLESNIETLQATRITPFPGTPLFAEMERQGRIVDHDWSHYDFNHVVYEPQRMDRETLSPGVSWVLRQFFGGRRVAGRVLRSFRHLDPRLVLGGVLPMNLGYMGRLALDGNLERGKGFVPAPPDPQPQTG